MADRDRRPRDGDGPRDRDSRRGRPRRDGERPAFRGGDRRSFDRPRRDSERPRGETGTPRPSFDRPRRDFDRPRRDGEGPRRDFDRPRRDGESPRREFDRPRRDFDRPRRDGEGPRRDFERPPGGRGRDDRPPFDRTRRGPDARRPFGSSRPSERFDESRARRDETAPPEFGPDRRREPRRDWQPRSPRFDDRGGGRVADRGGDGRALRGPRPRTTTSAGADTSQSLAEDEELIAGRRPVEEAFAARRDSIRLLVVPERRAALDQLVIHATTLRIPVVELEGGSLTALAGFDGHQGIALVARPRPPADVEAILAVARARNEAPFVLVLDSLEDPQNFGTLLRSAEAVGVHGVIYPTRRAAPLSPAAIKAAAGATEHLLLAAVEDLPGNLADLHSRGLRVVAAEENAALTYADADLRGGLALVVGSEGRGISAAVRRRLDLSVRIPMRGKIGSLNAAVAGSILLFAVAGQRPTPAGAVEEADPSTAEASTAELSTPEAPEPAPKPNRARRTKPVETTPVQPTAAETEPSELLPGDN